MGSGLKGLTLEEMKKNPYSSKKSTAAGIKGFLYLLGEASTDNDFWRKIGNGFYKELSPQEEDNGSENGEEDSGQDEPENGEDKQDEFENNLKNDDEEEKSKFKLLRDKIANLKRKKSKKKLDKKNNNKTPEPESKNESKNIINEPNKPETSNENDTQPEIDNPQNNNNEDKPENFQDNDNPTENTEGENGISNDEDSVSKFKSLRNKLAALKNKDARKKLAKEAIAPIMIGANILSKKAHELKEDIYHKLDEEDIPTWVSELKEQAKEIRQDPSPEQPSEIEDLLKELLKNSSSSVFKKNELKNLLKEFQYVNKMYGRFMFNPDEDDDTQNLEEDGEDPDEENNDDKDLENSENLEEVEGEDSDDEGDDDSDTPKLSEAEQYKLDTSTLYNIYFWNEFEKKVRGTLTEIYTSEKEPGNLSKVKKADISVLSEFLSPSNGDSSISEKIDSIVEIANRRLEKGKSSKSKSSNKPADKSTIVIRTFMIILHYLFKQKKVKTDNQKEFDKLKTKYSQKWDKLQTESDFRGKPKDILQKIKADYAKVRGYIEPYQPGDPEEASLKAFENNVLSKENANEENILEVLEAFTNDENKVYDHMEENVNYFDIAENIAKCIKKDPVRSQKATPDTRQSK